MCKVSVIVPYKNCAAYIEKCAVSLFEQSLGGVEYIFLDDASDDNTTDILESVVSRYPLLEGSVTIKHYEVNNGQAKVRDDAWRIAKGDYLFHCDADDWVDKGLLKCMYEEAVDNDCDIVTCDLKYILSSGDIKIWRQSPKSATDLCIGMIRALYTGSLCNKLIKRDLLYNDIVIPNYNMGEDWACCVQFTYNANKVGHVDDVYYNYLRHEGSSSFSVSSDQIIKRFRYFRDNYNIVYTYLQNHSAGSSFFEAMVFRCVNMKFNLFQAIDNDLFYKEWRSTHPEFFYKILKSHSLSVREKIIYLLAPIKLFKPIIRKVGRGMARV